MSPRIHINNLSLDIIEEIFYRVAFDTILSSNRTVPFVSIPAPHSPRYRSPASPFAISHVCRQWRWIALGSKRLWTHLCVIKPRTTALRHLLQVWMNRAEPISLHLSLHELDVLTPFATKTIVSLFLNSVHKCRSFQLNIRSDTLKIFDIKKLHIRPPAHLTYLNICSNDHSERPKARSALEPLFSAPALSSAVWSNPGPMRFKKSSGFWVHLHDLALLTPVGPEDLPTLLRACHALEKLVITHPRGSCRCVTLSKLRYLTVTIGPMDSLNWLTAPSLTDLELVLVRSHKLKTVKELTDRSSPRLRTLRVKRKTPKDTHFSRTEERMFLKLLGGNGFAELTELEVEQFVGNETLEFLTLPTLNTQEFDRRRSNLPDLRTVRLTFFPNSRLLDIRQHLDTLLTSRLSSFPGQKVQFSKDTLNLVLSLTFE